MDDKKTTTPRPEKERQPIPVAHLILPPHYTAAGLDTSSVTDGRVKAGQPYTIEYLPWLRHFRIQMNRPGAERTLMIHESVPRGWEELDSKKL